MIRHLFKLVWRRKRLNGLIILEIFVSFLVVFGVIASVIYLAAHYREPLGFDWAGVWNVQLDPGSTADEEWMAGQQRLLELVLDEVGALAEVKAAALATEVPYDNSVTRGTWEVDGRDVTMHITRASDAFPAVLGLELVAGRWFEESDSAHDREPLVLDLDLARALFGEEDPLGRGLPFDDMADTRVVGVVREYRKAGEFSAPGNFLFQRVRLDGGPSRRFPRDLVLRVRPGAGGEFEERLLALLGRLAPDWSVEVRPLEQMRESYLRLSLAPRIAGGVVAAFLMLMVGLGLIGVLWQNVTQRTREIGLRRATGAAAAHILRQVLGELLVMTTFGLALGALVVAQLPLLGLFGAMPASALWVSLAISSVLILGLAALCGLYPGWLATRVHPAEALHYD